jgi:hypothetical protein
MRRFVVRLSSFRFSVLAAASVVVGTTCTIVDASRQNDCRDSMTWLGYLGWTLVAGGSLASLPAVVRDQPAGRRLALIPAAIALLAFLVCLGLAAIRLSLRSLCGIDFML